MKGKNEQTYTRQMNFQLFIMTVLHRYFNYHCTLILHRHTKHSHTQLIYFQFIIIIFALCIITYPINKWACFNWTVLISLLWQGGAWPWQLIIKAKSINSRYALGDIWLLCCTLEIRCLPSLLNIRTGLYRSMDWF